MLGFIAAVSATVLVAASIQDHRVQTSVHAQPAGADAGRWERWAHPLDGAPETVGRKARAVRHASLSGMM